MLIFLLNFGTCEKVLQTCQHRTFAIAKRIAVEGISEKFVKWGTLYVGAEHSKPRRYSRWQEPANRDTIAASTMSVDVDAAAPDDSDFVRSSV